jgi:hypothetical protein
MRRFLPEPERCGTRDTLALAAIRMCPHAETARAREASIRHLRRLLSRHSHRPSRSLVSLSTTREARSAGGGTQAFAAMSRFVWLTVLVLRST